MKPLTKAAAGMAAITALARAAEVEPPGAGPTGAAAAAAAAAGLESACPPGTLPDARVCIPVPHEVAGGVELSSEQNAHRDRLGRWRYYDQIPRRPERPKDYRAYRFPIPLRSGQSFVTSGYDLHMPDENQRRGATLKAVGHGGIDLSQKRGTEVRMVNLEHQVGDAEVLFVGELFGNSVVTRHSLREGGQLREYLIIYGHLEGPAPGMKKGLNVREGELLGFVGDSGSPGDVHLHLEVRRVRDGVNAGELGQSNIAKNARTVACDPRNVLPLAGQ